MHREHLKACPRDFLERYDSAWTNYTRKRPQDCDRIGEKHQNVTAHYGIESLSRWNISHIVLAEPHIEKPRSDGACPGPRNRMRIPLDADDLTRRPNHARHQHRHVADTRADVQDPLSRSEASFAEESFGIGSQSRRLPDQALLLRLGAPEYVGSNFRHPGVRRSNVMFDVWLSIANRAERSAVEGVLVAGRSHILRLAAGELAVRQT
jgi:hypothetical protein